MVAPAWRVVPPQEAASRWDGWLASFSARHPRQSFAWGESKRGAWEPLYSGLFAGDKPLALAACQVRRAPLRAGTVAWANAGPVFADPAALSAFLKGLQEHLKSQPNPVLRVSPNALRDPDVEAALREAGFARARAALNTGLTYVLDLSPDLETLRSNLDRKWRNQLKGASKHALEFSAGRDAALLERYARLHAAMCRRKGLAAQRLDRAALERASAALGERISFLLVSKDGRDGCGAAVLNFAGRAILWHAASDDWGLGHGLANALYWRLIETLKEGGAQTFDLGGVDPKENWGVYNFKRGVGAAAVEWVGEWDWSPSPLAGLGFNWLLKALRGRLP